MTKPVRAVGAPRRAPMPVQRVARRVEDTAYAARGVGAAAVSGDRPFVIGLIGVLALAVVMLSGPFQSYVDGRARVEALQTKIEALDTENASLRQRRADLNDPANLELLAREQQGMIRPGEVPFAIVPPEVERPLITAPPRSAQRDVAWHERLWEALTTVFS
ncbi:MAG: septum formation initiator family protein [Actinobacteria bacterium]|nr:septum formation initiator family protein [Actinomycetota bacterium]